MYKKASLLWTFSRSFVPAVLVMDILCAHLVWTYGGGSIQAAVFLKLVSDGVIFYLLRTFRSSTFYYYRNLGLSLRVLWTSVLLCDLLLFAGGIVLALKTR